MEECEIDGFVGGGDGVFAVFVHWFWVWIAELGEVCWTRRRLKKETKACVCDYGLQQGARVSEPLLSA